MRRSLLVFALLLVCVGLANGQTFRGAINGNVTDPSGAIVPGAKVTATEKATGLQHATVSTSDGEFSFQDIPLGEYKVTVTASGFSPVTVDKVLVSAGIVYTLPVKLTLGQQATTMEVSAASLTLDTTTQVQTNTIASEVVQDIPLNGRDFTQLITLTPGTGGYNVGGFLSLNGTRANQMDWQIDGVDNNDFWHNIPAVNQGGVSGIAGIILPIDSIDEFSSQILSNAEAGRNAGGTVNQILKSGGSTLHGSAYYFNRNEAYGSGSPFLPSGTTKPKLRNQNWGGSVGGPLIKDRLFYFLNFEKQEYIIGLSGLATEPSPAWITKATRLLTNAGNTFGAYMPVAASPLSAVLLGTPAAISPTGFWPSLIGGLPATLGNFFSPIASTGYSYNGVIKLDFNINSKQHLSARWYGGQGSQTAPLGSSPALGTASSNLQSYFEKAPIHVYNYAVVLNSSFTPNFTNQLLFGVNYFNQVFNDFNSTFDTKALGLFLSPDATIGGKPILGAPNVAICPTNADGSCNGGFEQIGLTPPEGRNDITGILTDIASWSRGKHQFRFGGEFRQGHVNEFYHRRGTGKFTFNGTQGQWAPFIANCVTAATFPAACTAAGFASAADAGAAGALADFLAGDVSSSSIAVGNPERFVVVNAFSFFGQDSWQVTRKLNINVGLRYEYFGPLHSDRKDLAVFIVGKGLAIQGNGLDNIFPPDRNNFAPRLGFAYQPKENSSMVVRGGIGVYYDQVNMNPFLDFRPPISAADGLEDNPIGPSAVSNYSRSIYNWGSGAGQAQAGGASIFPPTTTCVSGKFVVGSTDCLSATTLYNIYSVNQNYRVPYFFTYNLQVEKSFGNSAVLQVGYVGSGGRKLGTILNINQTGTISCAVGCPFTNYGSIIQLNSIGTSNYNSLQTTFRIRSWHGLTSTFAYTWAHALDTGTQYRGVIPLDSFNLKQEYGNGDFDTRHNFTANWAYFLPNSSHGPKLLMHGWELTSLWEFHTGQPFNITGGFNRPGRNLVGNPFSGVNQAFVNSPAFTGSQWVNAAAFCVPGAAGCAGTASPNGNLARNKFYGPGFGSVDFSIIKNTHITERISAQFHLDMFNLFNRVNLASGGGAVNSDGTVTDTIGDFNGAPGIGPGEGFNLQLGLKIKF
jgi:hypothetical protein